MSSTGNYYMNLEPINKNNMKKEKMIFCAALISLGVFVSFTKPDAGGIALGHLVAVGAALFLGRVSKDSK